MFFGCRLFFSVLCLVRVLFGCSEVVYVFCVIVIVIVIGFWCRGGELYSLGEEESREEGVVGVCKLYWEWVRIGRNRRFLNFSLSFLLRDGYGVVIFVSRGCIFIVRVFYCI